jgi:hypothetical protein
MHFFSDFTFNELARGIIYAIEFALLTLVYRTAVSSRIKKFVSKTPPFDERKGLRVNLRKFVVALLSAWVLALLVSYAPASGNEEDEDPFTSQEQLSPEKQARFFYSRFSLISIILLFANFKSISKEEILNKRKEDASVRAD